MRLALAALIALCAAPPADALSCLRPSVVSSFGHAQDSPLVYVMASGRLTALPGDATPVPRDGPERPVASRARLDGHFATRTGFDNAISIPIQVETYCAGPWCGALPQGDLLLFLEKRGETYVLLEGPCPRFALTATPEGEAQAIACLTGSCPD